MRQDEAFLTTRLEKETEYIGTLLGKALSCPLTIALRGELGSGKTVLVRGAVRGMESDELVNSPTYVLMKIYHGKMDIYHFDFFRLDNSDDCELEGFDEYMPGDGVAFVEWPERFSRLLPPERLEISFERFQDKTGEGRRLWFNPSGKAASSLLDKLFEDITWQVDGNLNTGSTGSGSVTGRSGGNC